jgi:hypothetical protein
LFSTGQGRGEPIRISLWMSLPLALLGGLVIAMGLYPGPWLDWVSGVGPYLLSLGR